RLQERGVPVRQHPGERQHHRVFRHEDDHQDDQPDGRRVQPEPGPGGTSHDELRSGPTFTPHRRTAHLRNSSSASIPSAKGRAKSHTPAPTGAVPNSRFPGIVYTISRSSASSAATPSRSSGLLNSP